VNGTDSGNSDGLHTDDTRDSYQELGASWTLGLGEHAAVGALAQGRWSRLDSSTIGPTVGLEAGGLSAVALVGYTLGESSGDGVRSEIIVQLAL
jgi:hypothetical protein